MKRFFALLLLTLVFSSCDDGDLTEVTFEFDDTVAKECGTGTADFFIYKTQDRRALIIQLPESNFKNRLSADEPSQPLPLAINGSNIRLIYREYSGPVSQSTICSVVPAANPVVTDEREASEGKFTITTTALKSEPDANGATKITAFLHTLVFTDLKFDLGDGASQINEAFAQITYQTAATSFTNFAALPLINRCDNDNTVLFKFQNTQALVLDLSVADAAVLFTSEAGPKRIVVSNDSTLKHLFYTTTTTSLTPQYFCTTPLPGTPPVAETYIAVNGVLNQSGIIEVTTLPSVNGFTHTIVFRNVQLAKGTLNVQMGNAFVFGEIETPN
jgi:hypothetical protein